MNKEQETQEFKNYLVAEAKSQNKDPKQYVKELGEDGLKKAYERFQAHKKKQAQKALHGTKLNYFKSLKHQCAEDEELYYYKNGAKIECGCKKKEGGEVKPEKDCGGGAVAKFKKARKADSGMKMMQLVDANKNRKKQEEEKKKKANTWGATSTIVRKNSGNGDVNSKVQDNAVPDEDIPSHDKPKNKTIKTKGIKMKNDSLKCGGEVVKKFKAKCGSKLKKHQQGGTLIELLKKQ